MVKFLERFCVFMICMIVFEYNAYIKDYNEVVLLSNYISYDVKNAGLTSFFGEEYEVYIGMEGRRYE